MVELQDDYEKETEEKVGSGRTERAQIQTATDSGKITKMSNTHFLGA